MEEISAAWIRKKMEWKSFLTFLKQLRKRQRNYPKEIEKATDAEVKKLNRDKETQGIIFTLTKSIEWPSKQYLIKLFNQST